MVFRLNARHCLVTYAQCPLPKEEILEHILNTIGANIKNYVVAREDHKEAGHHIHCALLFHKKVDWRNPRVLDYEGYHPNIISKCTYKGAAKYAKKDGDFLEPPQDSDEEEEREGIVAIATRLTWEEFIEHCITNKIQYSWGQEVWKIAHPTNLNTILETDEVNGTLCEALSNLAFDPATAKNKSYVLTGESGTGKTTWCKLNCPKPALWVTHCDDLKNLRSEHKSIIFDDMCFTHWPIQSQIHLLDLYETRSINVKHGKVTIPKGIPRFFTSNDCPFSIESGGDGAEALRRRAKWITIRTAFTTPIIK